MFAYSDALNAYCIGPDGSYLDDGKLAAWQRHADFERAAFEEHRDLLDLALARGADPNGGISLYEAVQTMFDTSLVEWLLTHGADPNRETAGASYMPDLARTRRMLNLLYQHGALDNPYTMEMDPDNERLKQLTDQLKEQFV